MPINIYNENTGEKIDRLCDDLWDLPNQIDELEKWVTLNAVNFEKGNYVADIAFDIRNEATGGGAVLSSSTMKTMGNIGMDIYLSEYPNQLNDQS